MHLKLQHDLRQILDLAEVFALLCAKVNDAVTPRQVHPRGHWGKGSAAAAFSRY